MDILILIALVIVVVLLGLFARNIDKKSDRSRINHLKREARQDDNKEAGKDNYNNEISHMPRLIQNKYHGYTISEKGDRIFIDIEKIGGNIESIEIIDCWVELIDMKNKDGAFSLMIEHCHKVYAIHEIPAEQIDGLLHVLGKYFQRKVLWEFEKLKRQYNASFNKLLPGNDKEPSKIVVLCMNQTLIGQYNLVIKLLNPYIEIVNTYIEEDPKVSIDNIKMFLESIKPYINNLNA